jgi:putative hydrolase of the HAD superfamily
MEMNNNIKAIFLDVGSTLLMAVKDEPFQAEARAQFAPLVGAQESPEAFFDRLKLRWEIYRQWAFETLVDASEEELWTRFMLPDFPADTIAPLAGKLTKLWRARDGHRVARSDAKPTILELNRRGYALGIIANTPSEHEAPDWLRAEGLDQYFKAVILSSRIGMRKPGMKIYLEAARAAGIEPAHCAYVGDNPKRDVLGARLAGYGMSIILTELAKLEKDPPTPETKPDLVIESLGELLNIFPCR